MSAVMPPQRCRAVLTIDVARSGVVEDITKHAQLSDLASVILYKSQADFSRFQEQMAVLVSFFQARGVAVMIAGDSQIAGRLGADGIHIEGDKHLFQDLITRHGRRMILGFGGLKSRHDAMEIGELEPDYVMFGKLGADIDAAPHPRNLNLGSWWAMMMEIPCIVQAGAQMASLVEVAQTGAEFVALERAVLANDNMAHALENANFLLDHDALTTREDIE